MCVDRTHCGRANNYDTRANFASCGGEIHSRLAFGHAPGSIPQRRSRSLFVFTVLENNPNFVRFPVNVSIILLVLRVILSTNDVQLTKMDIKYQFGSRCVGVAGGYAYAIAATTHVHIVKDPLRFLVCQSALARSLRVLKASRLRRVTN